MNGMPGTKGSVRKSKGLGGGAEGVLRGGVGGWCWVC